MFGFFEITELNETRDNEKKENKLLTLAKEINNGEEIKIEDLDKPMF